MKHQKGAALIVVLSLLVVSLMLGLSSMQSSQIDERLAGNYKSSSQAQMNSEKGVSEFYSWLSNKVSNSGWPEEDEQDAWKNNVFLSMDGYQILGYEGDTVEWLGDEVRFRARGEEGFAVSDTYAVFSLFSDPFGGLDVNGAFTCYGVSCIVGPGSGRASNSFNGHDHDVDEINGCSFTGSNEPDINESGESKAGVFIPEGSLESGAEDNIEGEPGVVSDMEMFKAYSGFDESMTSTEVRHELNEMQNNFNEKLDDMMGRATSSGTADVSGMSVFHYAGPGETVKLDGNAGGVIILEGGTLEMRGNSCFTGIVLARESATESQIIVPEFDTRGTAAIVGGVVGQSIDFSGRGTPSVYYSSKAISIYSSEFIGGESLGLNIREWDMM